MAYDGFCGVSLFGAESLNKSNRITSRNNNIHRIYSHYTYASRFRFYIFAHLHLPHCKCHCKHCEFSRFSSIYYSLSSKMCFAGFSVPSFFPRNLVLLVFIVLFCLMFGPFLLSICSRSIYASGMGVSDCWQINSLKAFGICILCIWFVLEVGCAGYMHHSSTALSKYVCKYAQKSSSRHTR